MQRGFITPLLNLPQHVLRKIEQWSYETALHRPTLTKLRRVQLVAKAWLAAKTAKPRRAVRP